MDQALDEITIQNGGFFTRGQALDCGWVDRELTTAVRQGVLRRLRHGAYTTADIYERASETERHVLLARAALARQRGSVALTGVSAAALYGLTLHEQDLSTVHLVRLDRGSARHEIGTKHHLVSADLTTEVEEHRGVPVVSLARTVWEVATMSSFESGVCTADSALRAFPGLMAELRETASSFDHRPGSRRARMTIQFADGGSASAGESLSRVLFYRRGLPAPELQHDVLGRGGQLIGIADFYWPDHNHLGEFDGKVKYKGLLKDGEAPGDAVFREKRREDQIRAEHYGMTRWTWADLMPAHSPAFVQRLKEDLVRSRALYGTRHQIIA